MVTFLVINFMCVVIFVLINVNVKNVNNKLKYLLRSFLSIIAVFLDSVLA